MTDSERNTIQQAFADRCDDLLDVMVEQMHQEETWDLYLAKGAGDRAIAGDHEERHLLELLQNARDAIYRDRARHDAPPGRVFVAVTEHGMAMANTGDPFRLNDKEVLKAVRFLQRSDKISRGFIGHKGVGLKSILLRAGAFSVRSRIDGQTLRATFSRSRTAEHLLQHLNQEANSVSHDQTLYIRQHLPRLPLFTQPHADSADGDELGEDDALVEALLGDVKTRKLGLDDNGRPTVLAPYTTVVYLPYRDERWEQQLEAVEEKLPSEKYRAIFNRAKQQTGVVSHRANTGEVWDELIQLDRRMLVLLGEIMELQFARFEDGDLREVHRIDIERPLSPLNVEQEAQPRRIKVREQRWSLSSEVDDTTQRSFTVLSTPTDLGIAGEEYSDIQGPREHIRILLETPTSDDFRFRSEPLFLYYPIETEPSGLPFLIHGPFRVNSSRTALVKGQREHNQQVLDEAVALLERQLPSLLDESVDIRRWLPWILLPLIDPEAEEHAEAPSLQVRLCRDLIELLKQTESVPTLTGCAHPECVHFFPSRPDALLFPEDYLQRSSVEKEKSHSLRLLAPENRETYQRLQHQDSDWLVQAARQIGLGQVGLMSFVDALATCFDTSRSQSMISAKTGHARAFFLNLCALLEESDRETAREAARTLGTDRIPLLPALGADGKEGEQLKMVRAEVRRRDDSARLQKASRVVFWQRSGKDRRTDISSPPSAVPVHFIAPSVVEENPAQAEWALSTFGEEWLTAAFNSRPDLFRRVAERAGDLEPEGIPPVLGYLAALLHQITSQSFSGAEDLQPGPYGAIDLGTLHRALHRYRASSDRRRAARNQLQLLQQWAQILVPVQRDEAPWAHASSAVFGPAWCDVLDDFLATVEDEEKREELSSYERWTEAIHRLNIYRDRVGRAPDDPEFPTLLPPDPDHPNWKPTIQELRQIVGESDPTLHLKALFDLLLLLGVRVGPQVDWRWVDNSGQAEPFDPIGQAIDLTTSEDIFEGKNVPKRVIPGDLARSDLMKAYCETITLRPHHTAFSGGHSRGNRRHLRRSGRNTSQLAAWIWIPDLVGSDADETPLGGDHTSVDAFREMLLPLWPDLSEQVLETGWYSERGHRGRSWEKTIPSLAAFQLARLRLWEARPVGHVHNVDQRRFSASAMVAWERPEDPGSRDLVRFFPLFDASDDALSAIARDLGVVPLSEMNLLEATLRLGWLLKESRDEECEVEDIPPDCWPIDAFTGTNRNDWLGAQYYLLEKIVYTEPESLWNQRVIGRCGLTLRAARVGGQVEIAIPVVTGQDGKARFEADVAFFENPPRRWDKREYEGKWELQVRSQLRRSMHQWATRLGAESLKTVKPPPFAGDQVPAPEAIDTLQRKVEDRLDLILGVLKANRVENLEEKAQQLLKAMDSLRAVKPTGAQNDGLSGLDDKGRLAFSYKAYKLEQERGGSGAVVLAEGLALLLEQPTAVGDLQHALTAPREQVALALDFRGVDVDALLGEVASLAKKHLDRLLKRIDQLLCALSAAGVKPASLPTWHTDGLIADERMRVISKLKEARGKLAEQALKAIREAAPRVSEASRATLLRTALDESSSTLTRTRSLLDTLREAGWTTNERQAFIERDASGIPFRLVKEEGHAKKALNSAVLIALLHQLHTDELDAAKDSLQELSNLGHKLRSQLSLRVTNSGKHLLDHLETKLSITVSFDPPDLLLIEWDERIWNQLTQTLRDAGNELLPDEPENARKLLEDCLKQGSLALLHEYHRETLSETQIVIQRLEHRLAQRGLSFNPEELLGSNAVKTVSSAGTSEPGQGSGVGGVTSNQAIRGRVAELFVLQSCWVRFLESDEDTRRQTMEDIETRRCEGSGQGDDHIAWSTKTAWRKLEKRLEPRREKLISCTEDDIDLMKLFKDLIEVANERGPGYDVLDPFGAWGSASAKNPPEPCRVEVKAVLRDPETKTPYRIVLTTNEFHRACRDPESYVLRLISVPREPEDHLDQVRWICDIPDPVRRLNLKEQIGKGVRGGSLPLTLEISEPDGE